MMEGMESEDYLEFAFPNLSPLRGCGMEHPYIYILTDKTGKYLGVFPTLKHLAYHFGLQSRSYEPQEYLMQAWWLDNRIYFVPHDLVFGGDKPNPVLNFEAVPEHFLERNLEAYQVEWFWKEEERKAKGLPELWLDNPFKHYPPECIPEIGWVDAHHPLHSANKTE